MYMTAALVLSSMVLNTLGQLLLKETMIRIGSFSFAVHNLIPIGLKIIFSPFFLAGLFCYILSLCIWLLVLSRLDVTVAYPLTSIAFIFTAFAAAFCFHEELTMIRILGIVVIIAGIYLLTRSA